MLPKTPYLHVDPKVYEKVLIHFLDNDQFDEILTYLAKWPCELYDTQPIKSRLESIIHDADYDAAAGKRKMNLKRHSRTFILLLVIPDQLYTIVGAA